MLSREFRLSNIVGNFDCFTAIFDIHSKENDKFLAEAFISNQQTLEVKSMPWKEDTKLITFGSQHSMLTPKQIQEEVRGEQVKRLSNTERFKKCIKPKYNILENLKTF